MNLPNLELFGSAPESPSPDSTDSKYASLLEAILAAAGRKNAWKAMTPEARNDLGAAIEIVARAKRAAYEAARAGVKRTADNWINRDEALARAVAKLHAAFVECDSIPMAEA